MHPFRNWMITAFYTWVITAFATLTSFFLYLLTTVLLTIYTSLLDSLCADFLRPNYLTMSCKCPSVGGDHSGREESRPSKTCSLQLLVKLFFVALITPVLPIIYKSLLCRLHADLPFVINISCECPSMWIVLSGREGSLPSKTCPMQILVQLYCCFLDCLSVYHLYKRVMQATRFFSLYLILLVCPASVLLCEVSLQDVKDHGLPQILSFATLLKSFLVAL